MCEIVTFLCQTLLFLRLIHFSALSRVWVVRKWRYRMCVKDAVNDAKTKMHVYDSKSKYVPLRLAFQVHIYMS